MDIRQREEEKEKRTLSPLATLSTETQGRRELEEPCSVRTAFQRDRDRIIHSKAFRRLKHKTQVFLSPTGDHYRTRLTHTLEVAQIARTVAVALRLNENLTEAIALGHDLGHTPFGHAGESVLNDIFPGGFSHHKHSLRVVDTLEKRGKGLNLTKEVREGIVNHTKGKNPILSSGTSSPHSTLEAKVVRVCDVIAYVNHDLDDALRGGVLVEKDIPRDWGMILGRTHAKRIDTMVRDLIFTSIEHEGPDLHMSDEVYEVLLSMRAFLFEKVYETHKVHDDFIRAQKIIRELYARFLEDDEAYHREIDNPLPNTSREQTVCDFIAGMTDRYALHLYEQLFFPHPWKIY